MTKKPLKFKHVNSRELEMAKDRMHTCGTAILFDLDGVLVDVSSSYRKAIQKTVQFFTGKKIESEEIQKFKERSGYNNDWDLTEAIIFQKGKSVPKSDIIERFQDFYIGSNDKKGFIQNEKWLLSKEILNKLNQRHKLGIVTGRPREETLFVLKKFDFETSFDVVITMEDYPAEKAKPNPLPINLALKEIGEVEAVYIGDSVDDIISAKRAHIRAIGCIPPGIRSENLKKQLLKYGAESVFESVNEIGKMFLCGRTSKTKT